MYGGGGVAHPIATLFPIVQPWGSAPAYLHQHRHHRDTLPKSLPPLHTCLLLQLGVLLSLTMCTARTALQGPKAGHRDSLSFLFQQ